MTPKSPITIRIETDDALRIRADVLVLKYAQGLYGADAPLSSDSIVLRSSPDCRSRVRIACSNGRNTWGRSGPVSRR